MTIRECAFPCLVSLMAVVACGDSTFRDASNNGTGESSGDNVGGGFGVGGASSGGDSQGAGASCSADFAGASLQPVYLAFAFDVSGSMGKLDDSWHDPALKWEPVVAATKAFFADTTSSGVSASLTFFPAEKDKCAATTYGTPAVPMTLLPSNAFASAIDAVTPQSSSDWRGGTPTLAVTKGTFSLIETLAQNEPAAEYAYVLVTDGYPQGCDGDDDINLVVDAIASVADFIPTYVIGVSNPAPGPDTVSNLEALAVAGGTNAAFIIQTGDPAQTATAFEAAISAIKSNAVSCKAAIPDNPGGQPFDKSKVNVDYTKDGKTTSLGYDPTCEQDDGWRYDDPDNPKSIVLCPGACAEAQKPGAHLSVEFGCGTHLATPS